MATGGVGHHTSRVSSRAKGQIGGRVGICRVGGEVRRWGEVGHAGQRCLRLMLGLAGGVRCLKLVRESVALLAGRQVVELLRKIKE